MRSVSSVAGLRALCAATLSSESVVVEIGCFAGESTAVFAPCCARIHAIDPWSDAYLDQSTEGCASGSVVEQARRGMTPMAQVERQFDQRVARFRNVIKHRTTDDQVVGQFDDGSLDMVYIDSIHTYDAVRDTIERWRAKVRPGGWIAGHDYSDIWPGVKRAVDEAFGAPDQVYADTSWACRLA